MARRCPDAAFANKEALLARRFADAVIELRAANIDKPLSEWAYWTDIAIRDNAELGAYHARLAYEAHPRYRTSD